MTTPNPPVPAPIKIDMSALDNIEIRYRNQLDSGILVADPARAIFTSLAVRRLSKLSMDLGLGTEHPDKMLVVSDRQNLYFAPVLDHPKADDVYWQGNRGSVNIIKVFTLLRRLLAPGTHEFYRIDDEVVTIEDDGQQFQALRAPLKKVSLNRIGGLRKRKSTSASGKKTSTSSKKASTSSKKTATTTETNA